VAVGVLLSLFLRRRVDARALIPLLGLYGVFIAIVVLMR